MHPSSAAEALGAHANYFGGLLVETVRHRHARFAEAHQVSGSRYGTGFGSQWRDLLDDVADAAHDDGYRTFRLRPAGYRLPVVNGCLVYVWRVPESSRGIEAFASSPTRVSGFVAPPLPPMLFDTVPGGSDEGGPTASREVSVLTDVLDEATEGSMPLVLVAVHSSPRQLQFIEWGVAELDPQSGDVTLHGRARLWVAEPEAAAVPGGVAAFDSGAPVRPVLEPREQEGMDSNGR